MIVASGSRRRPENTTPTKFEDFAGLEGEAADWPAFDYVIQARLGVAALTGEPDGPPALVGYSAVDNSAGIMAALGILSFIYSWNAFLWPLIIGQKPPYWTAQIAVSTFLTAQTINLPMLFMGAAVAAAPLVFVFLIMQRFIVQGVRLSGIKG